MQYDTIQYYTILYCAILYYTILYYAVLYYSMLCYSILCYSMLSSCRLWVRLTLEHLDPSPPRDPVPIDVDTGAELKRPAPEPAAADPLRWPAPMLLPSLFIRFAIDDGPRHDGGIGAGQRSGLAASGTGA